MSVRLTSQENRVAMFDSTSGYAFGPTFEDEETAEAFLEFVQASGARGALAITSATLNAIYERFIALGEENR